MSHRLQVLISETLDARVAKAAQRMRQSKGEWVRRAIENALESGIKKAKIDPVLELAGLNGPTSDIDQMLSEIDKGRS